jgi:hypothetical protein
MRWSSTLLATKRLGEEPKPVDGPLVFESSAQPGQVSKGLKFWPVTIVLLGSRLGRDEYSSHCKDPALWEVEIGHVRLFGQRPGRSDVLAVDKGAALGHVPDPNRVGIEVLSVRGQPREIHGPGTKSATRQMSHRLQDRAGSPRRKGQRRPGCAHRAGHERRADLDRPIHHRVFRGYPQPRRPFPPEVDWNDAGALDIRSEIASARNLAGRRLMERPSPLWVPLPDRGEPIAHRRRRPAPQAEHVTRPEWQAHDPIARDAFIGPWWKRRILLDLAGELRRLFHFGFAQGRASKTMLNGVSATRRNRPNPASVTISRMRASPACAPSASPTGWESEHGVHSKVEKA